MVDLKLLEKKGVTCDTLKNNLMGDPKEWGEDDKRWKLWNRIRSRVQEGMQKNFRDWKLWYALDQAWETPFKQITPTLLQTFIGTDPTEEQVYKQLQDWGLTSLVTQQNDPRTGQPTGKKVFNLPVFFNIFVPLVRAYVTIRWAKIMNDRRLTPFLKYEPRKATLPLRLRCETITDRIQVMSEQYNYYEVVKQGVLKLLHYGQCFQVPREEWHSEQQWKYADEEDVAFGKRKPAKEGEGGADENDGTVPVNVGDEIKVTTREGIRYYHPHPTRFFYDEAHGPYTFNADSGCEFFGYWRVVRYRDIKEQPAFWNVDKVSLGTADLMVNNQLFFQSVYSACTLKLAVAAPAPARSDGVAVPALAHGVGTGDLDREKDLANQYYGTEHLDQGVLQTEYFERLVPSENGLGDYDCPVWFRFVLASDGCSILYAAPLPSSPVLYAGYDSDESRRMPASLALEILPFQDQMTNVLNQIILTAKQNLANLTMVDEDQITDDTKAKIQGVGESLYRYLNVFGYSGKKGFRGMNKVSEAVQSFSLPKGSVAELMSVVKMLLDILERILVMSSHEVAQPASHEQTREEVRNIASSSTSRQAFTATPVDIMRDAMKRQLYCFTMQYGDDDMYANIPSETPLTQEALNKMGYTFVDKDNWGKNDRYHRARTSKKFTAVPLWEFASTRDGDDRINDSAVAVTMSQMMQNLMQNPIVAQAIGPAQAIEIANQIAQKAGFDRDFKLRDVSPEITPEQQQQAAQVQLKQVIDQVLQTVDQQMQVKLKPLLDEVKKDGEDIDFMKKLLTGETPMAKAA